jgi:hypothetical protein
MSEPVPPNQDPAQATTGHEPGNQTSPPEPPLTTPGPTLVTPAATTTDARSLALVAARKRDRLIGMSVVAVAFAIGLGISYWAKYASRPETSEPPGPPTTVGIKGWPAKVDVVATLPGARAVTKRALLRGISVEGVSSDGTLDLTEGPGRARYVFQSAPGQGPQPVTATGVVSRFPYCGKQDVQLRREGLVADPDRPMTQCGPKAGEALPDPRCSLATIWRAAISRGFATDKLARIEYFRATGGPAWRFEAEAGSFVLYGDCQRELKGSAAVGHVP